MSIHAKFMQIALDEAKKSPPKPTNFCVGACLVASDSVDKPLITGYTLECEGNTHAEQCCFIKLSEVYKCDVGELGRHLPHDTVLYTTMEPCNKRSVGNTPCVDRILGLRRKDGTQAIKTVFVGVGEPETFVGINEGRKKLEDAGINVQHVTGFEDEILTVATAGHDKHNE
ncbi:cytidine deaminase-like protein [Acrodontium crateriforme]|uniref:Cytidine deaminase-like protein n=1 Tax=Acrodontium crateriforme TaxID=150365 RepID=A0AAQ3LZI5_9PEZI|nr:cytidine deaminase-like protein [Acrodontium crateriforme]